MSAGPLTMGVDVVTVAEAAARFSVLDVGCGPGVCFPCKWYCSHPCE